MDATVRRYCWLYLALWSISLAGEFGVWMAWHVGELTDFGIFRAMAFPASLNVLSLALLRNLYYRNRPPRGFTVIQQQDIPTAQRHTAFTMIELLVVIVLIVLLLLLALPAFNLISGNRSIELARNEISAMLSQARRTAVSSQQTSGVLFFYDPVTDRETLVPVYFPNTPPAWSYKDDRYGAPASPGAGLDYKGNPIQYNVGDRVMRLHAEDGTNMGAGYPTGEGVASPANQRPVVRFYTCIQQHTPSTLNGPQYPLTGQHAQCWKLDTNGELKAIEGSDWQTLPGGVSAQLINDTGVTGDILMKNGVTGIPKDPYDQYEGFGVIAFDKLGRLTEMTYTLRDTAALGTSTFGEKLQIQSVMPAAANEPYPRTCFGVALFDTEAFRNQPGATVGDWQNSSSFQTSAAPASLADEMTEEQWIANNAMHLMVNRLNGTLVKVE